MKKIFKWLLAIFLYYTGMLKIFERYNSYSSGGLWILGYYRVSNAKDDDFNMVVPVKHFQKQMRYLKRRYNIISFDEALEKINNYEEFAPRSLIVTFDNGYKDVYLNAFPILQELDIKATVFLVTDYVGSGNLLWFDELAEMVKSSTVRRVAIKSDTGEEFYDLREPDSKDKILSKLLQIIKNIKPEDRREYLKELRDLLEVKGVINQDKVLLDWQEIKKMCDYGIGFGSQGKSHTSLTVLGPLDLEKEISDSKNIIEGNIHRPVCLFSYPNGSESDFSDLVISKLYRSGYRASCTNILGKNKDKRDLYKLKRRGIERESSTSFFGMFSRAIFACEVSGFFDLIFVRRQRQSVY